MSARPRGVVPECRTDLQTDGTRGSTERICVGMIFSNVLNLGVINKSNNALNSGDTVLAFSSEWPLDSKNVFFNFNKSHYLCFLHLTTFF
jgi:hypothetical protein